MKTIKAAVLGWPVSHSLSPRLHGYWLKEYGIDGTYEAIAVEPKNMKNMLRELADEGFAGVNLTLPHKEAALALMDKVEATAQRIGAVNTIVMSGGKLIGSNTDAYGFIQNLKSHQVVFSDSRTVVLGAGGAARAVVAGLLQEGAQVTLVNRTREKADALAQAMGAQVSVAAWEEREAVMKDATLLVNTTSLGMKNQPPLDISLTHLPLSAVVTDIVYNPLITPLLAAAQTRGNKIVDGLGMLLYQAQPGFEAWFGRLPEVTPALRAHVLAGLAP